MGGFLHHKIFGGAEIIAPVEVIDPVGILSGQLHGTVSRTGVRDYDLKAVRNKMLTAFLNMFFFISGYDTD